MNRKSVKEFLDELSMLLQQAKTLHSFYIYIQKAPKVLRRMVILAEEIFKNL